MSIALDEIRERAVSVSQGAYRVVRADDFEALVTEVERLLAQRILSNEDFARSFDMGLAAGERRERVAAVTWLREEYDDEKTRFAADAIEHGEHREVMP
jgi:uncharacterized protein YqgQ